MKILIDIGHPAHVHYFKNLAKYCVEKGSSVLFIAREKDVAIDLLNWYTFNYIVIGKPFRSKIGKLWGLFYFTFKFLAVALDFKPDYILNATFYSSLTAWLIRKPHFSIEDTFNPESTRLFVPFTDLIFTGKYEHPNLGKKQIELDSYQELLYLHPNNFTPNPSVLDELGINKNEKYTIIRYVAWNASHDFGHTGISINNKEKIIKNFSEYGRVFISSEGELPAYLEKYRFPLKPYKIHDAIAFASLVFGESYTLVSEAAVLGVPTILLHNTKCYYTFDQEMKYGLVFNYSETEEDQERAIKKGVEILMQDNIISEWKNKHNQMLTEKIDYTSFLIWFIENWPASFKIMKENPDYQYRFK